MITFINYKKIVLAFAFGMLFSNIFAQDEIISKVSSAFEKGDSKELSLSLNDQIEMTLLDNENIFSRSQAAVLLKKFFDNNKPTSFKILHKGNRNGTNFAIGNYVSNNTEYRVYFLLKGEKENKKIHLLRIENKNEQ